MKRTAQGIQRMRAAVVMGAQRNSVDSGHRGNPFIIEIFNSLESLTKYLHKVPKRIMLCKVESRESFRIFINIILLLLT